MKPRHQVSRAAIDLIKRFEGYRPKAAQLPNGRWTIGYGHTLTAREGAEVSERDAEALLLYDLIAVAHVVNETTYTPLTQNQFDALCSFAFNIGVENFRRSSVLRRLNEGQLLLAACGMELWRKADFEGERIVIDALVRRRAAEKTLFLTPMDGWVPAPSPVLRPNLDADVSGIVPRETPLVVRTALDGLHAVAERDLQASPLQPVPPEEGEAEPSPAQAAAAAVSYRLQAIFREPKIEAAPPEATQAEPITDEAEPEAQAGANPAEASAVSLENLLAPTDLQPETPAEPESASAPAAPVFGSVAGLAMAGGAERAFVLTPPEPDVEQAEPEARLEAATEAGADSAPSLFDRPILAANDLMASPLAATPPVELDPRPLLMIDDTAPEPAILTFEPAPQVEEKASLGGLLVLAGLGLALFAGGLFWAFNARVDGDGLISPLVVGWVAGIAGVGFFGVAAYLILQRFGGEDDLETEHNRFN
ncbi:lysozyme [Phenylobacterium sp.]|uniref:lysozyme n=1 Tax=Phenylobacterium sp. TaxID=1871053 RepID=UPI002731F4B9|nr:glycoside hydrolase family protein [Phenylobacterium sp.]MDP1988969.1 glycoside hydrolase family protein [Phenylobacterium sp.]